jgi:adenosylcobyric acid synthase
VSGAGGNTNVLGIYLHGLFESPRVLERLFGARARGMEDVFEALADFIEPRFGHRVLTELAHGAKS